MGGSRKLPLQSDQERGRRQRHAAPDRRALIHGESLPRPEQHRGGNPLLPPGGSTQQKISALGQRI